MGRLAVRAVTRGPRHHFFGYYDKCPWNRSGRLLLGLEAGFMERPPGPADRALIGLINLEAGSAWQAVAATSAWNWQQGSMLQWLGSDPERLILYNIREEDGFAAVAQDVHSGVKRVLPRPVYAASRDGRQAVSVNFARIHQTRPGYGYAGLEDPWEHELQPADDGIYWMDLESGNNHLIISLDQIVGIRPVQSMEGAKHWFNHLQFNPDGSRFLFLHRWVDAKGRRNTRLFTANPDGTEIHCVADHELVSHFDWRNKKQILAWARQRGIGDFYFLFTDQSDQVEVVGKGVLTKDGHCSYSPGGRWLLTDTYPDEESQRSLILYRLADARRFDLGRFYALPEIAGEIRCDLHPRWSRDGRQICFDSVHQGTRQIYVVDVGGIVGG